MDRDDPAYLGQAGTALFFWRSTTLGCSDSWPERYGGAPRLQHWTAIDATWDTTILM